MKHYLRLVKYANDLGYKVVEAHCDSWDAHTKTICNNKRRTVENRIIYMIHEIGHAHYYEKNKDTYLEKHPGLNSSEKIKIKASEMEQEALAWYVGLEIARSIGVFVNERKYAQIKTKCMQSYL